MRYRIVYVDAARPSETVEADDHAVVGPHHVLTREVLVAGMPRRAVVRRVPVRDVTSVEAYSEPVADGVR